MSEKHTSKFIIYQSEDGEIRLDVRFMEETVWLTQALMAQLFNTSKQNISLHLKNIFTEQELDENSVVKNCLTTAVDNKQYAIKHYNLDTIISVGCAAKETELAHDLTPLLKKQAKGAEISGMSAYEK